MQTLEQANDWAMWMEQYEPENTLSSVASALTDGHESPVDSWERTDRQLHFRARPATPSQVDYGSSTRPTESQSLRGRWFRENDVHTEFLDAGIGCCWCAYQGDDEPVYAETEDAAIALLARENGLPLNEPFALLDASNRSTTR